jgi:hypothetical protein
MNDSKFVGVCIIIAALLIGGSIIYERLAKPEQIGRYQFQASTPPGIIWILDTTTGETKTR